MKLRPRSAAHRCDCDCCAEDADRTEFHKIVQSEDIGLTIYQYTPGIQDEKDTTGEVFILRNTKNTKVTTDDLAAVFEQNAVTCPRCLKNIVKAENFLRSIPAMDRDEVTGICDHCVRKQRPLSSICKCKDVVDKFLLEEQERRREVKTWLNQVRLQLNKSPDKRVQRKKLKTFSQSEISLNTAVSKFSETNYKYFAENQVRGRLPRTRAASSLDSLQDVDQFTKKEFEHFLTPMKDLKEKIDRRKIQEKQFPDSIFSDTQEYVKRVISPEEAAKGPVPVKPVIKYPDEILAGKKLEHYDSYLDIRKEVEFKQKRNRDDEKIKQTYLDIPKEVELKQKGDKDDEKTEQTYLDIPKEGELKQKGDKDDEKIKHRQSSIIRDARAPADRGRRRSSFPSPPWKKHSDESFLKTISGKVPKVFSFSFPHEREEKKKIVQQASSSELIKNTQEVLQAKAEEEKRKKEEEMKRKREEMEQKRLEREKKREEALAAKAAKAAFEEKRRQEAKLDKQKMQEEQRKQLEEKVSLVSVTEKLEENKNTPDTSLSSKPKSDKRRHQMPVVKPKTVIDKETLVTEKKAPKTKPDKLEAKEPIKKDKDHREKDVITEDKKTQVKKDLLDDIKKSKPATKEPKEKVTAEKNSEGDNRQTKEAKQKITEEKKSDGNNKQTKETKQKITEEKKSDGDNKQTKEPKQKTTEEKKSEGDEIQTKEPKGKTDKTDKLEHDTLKALLASQQKEKQEQEKMMKEQQRQEELARKKAMEAVKAPKSGDKNVKEDAASKLQKIKELAEIPSEPHPSKNEPPTNKELALKQVKMMQPSTDDLLLKLVKLQKEENKLKLANVNPVIVRQHGQTHRKKKLTGCVICSNSDLALEFDEYEMEQNNMKLETVKDIIIGEKIYKFKAPFKLPQDDFNIQGDNFELQESQEAAVKESEQISQPTRTTKTKPDAVEPEPAKGIIRYALSDRSFIEKGWTMLPTEKVVRKMNVYRMRPAHPEFDWFEHNKYKRIMQYDCGAKLAEFDDNGRGRWYYRSGQLALDYYDAEELNAQQRFVVYSSGEPDERGRTRPRTILAAFDYLGNGVVFDHTGKIRLKYNQTEGVVLDRSIGPASHWKWHTLNDPPVLQQVMIDTQMPFKDPRILKLGEKSQEKPKVDNEEMLAIEFDNFIKEKGRKLTQKFKPFQIKMKALKINEYFSLRVLDQATVYLLFRDGTTNLKINMGMILDHKEIVDTETAEVEEVGNSLERMPARTDSIAALQQAVAQAQRQEHARVRRERRLKPAEPRASVDQMRAAASRPLRPPLMVDSSTGTGIQCHPHCPNRFKKSSSSNLYYDTRL